MFARWFKNLFQKSPASAPARPLNAAAPRFVPPATPEKPSRAEPPPARQKAPARQEAAAPPVAAGAVVSHPAYGVISIRIQRQDAATACYLVDETLLIDTGCVWARPALRKTLLELGADKTIREVVNTHDHDGAIGNNALLLELARPKVFAHYLAIPEIRFPDEDGAARLGNAPVEAEPLPEKLHTAHCELEVLPLPGHSPGHIGLFEPGQRWLFCADLNAVGAGELELLDADGPRWLASLDKAIALRPACMYDARGAVWSQENEVVARLERERGFLLELRNQILQKAPDAGTLQELTRKVFEQPEWLKRVSCDGWQALLDAPAPVRCKFVRSFLCDMHAPG